MNPAIFITIALLGRWFIRRLRRSFGNQKGWHLPWTWWPLTGVAIALIWVLALFTHHPRWLILGAVITPLCFPWAFTRYVLIPRGRIRAAYYGGRFSEWTWRAAPRAGAVAAALFARFHATDVVAGTDAWLRRQVDQDTTLTGPHLLTAALLAELDGKHDICRQQMRLILHFHQDTTTETTNRGARQWLALDAARRGAWHEILELDNGWGWYGGPQLSLLLAVARRLTGEGRPVSDFGLRLRWWLCGQKPLQRPLLQRALAVGKTPPAGRPGSTTDVAPRDPTPPGDADPVATALDLHGRLLRRSQPTGADLRQLDAAWALALEDPKLMGRIHQRIQTLGARTSPAQVLEDFRQQLTDSLRQVVDDVPALATSLPYFGDLGWQRLEHLVEALESSTWRLQERYEDGRPLPAMQELTELCQILDLYERLVRGGGHRAMALSMVGDVLWNWAAWLFNDRQQTPLGRACFHWLLLEGKAVGNDDLVHNMEQNLNCGF